MADDFLKNEDWVQRMNEKFMWLDTNKNGSLEVDDWKDWVQSIERATNASEDLISKVQRAVDEFCIAIGVTPGKSLSKEQFIREFATFAAAERAIKERGGQPILYKLYGAIYDVIDMNKDGYVTLSEYKAVMKACNYDMNEIFKTFCQMDSDISGKIDRQEMAEYQYRTWIDLQKPKAKKKY
uniref:Obelin-like protein n=1 Tax=Halisarca dujardinii TaxID=2583056 RepID=A0AA96MI82_HALDU|nr:obelin-like protein [Halisarca dujardinii]